MKRVFILLYGVVCYLLFLAAFLYLIGFVGDLLVPRSVDRGNPSAGPGGWLANLGLVALFGLQHGLMARRPFKAWITRFIPSAMERSTFVLATVAVLTLLYTQWRPMPDVVWSVEHPVGRAVLHALFAAGFGIVLVSTFLIDHFDLFGLRQSWLGFRGKPYTKLRFTTRLFYRHVRHPLMLGFLIAFWATPTMTLGHLLFAGAMSCYIFVGIAMEERDLLRDDPQNYGAYRQTVPMILPLPRGRTAAAAVTAE
ncbi:MAG TPA: NnrU family protein [Planctomycetota bacterium]|nr:NnrU family protein [Planctomycetota bacterium]